MSIDHEIRSEEGSIIFEELQVFVRPAMSRLRVQSVPVGESLTLQSEASACDINNIIARFDRDGFLPAARVEGQYGDVSMLNRDLGELMNDGLQIMSDYAAAAAEFEKKKSADAKALMDEKERIYNEYLANKDKSPPPAAS